LAHVVRLLAAGIGIGFLAGLLVPRIVRMIPEPETDAGEPVKELYADIANREWLAWQAAAIASVVGGLLSVATDSLMTLMAIAPLIPVGVALGFIDWRTRLLPRVVVLPATAYLILLGSAAALASGAWDQWVRAILGLFAARTLFWILWRVRRSGMGFGDVRLAALLGFALAWLGWAQWFVGLYAGFLLLSVPGLVWALLKRRGDFLKVAVPFGPFMLVGAVLGVVLGGPVASYLG